MPHGLPQKPQAQSQTQAGPSRPQAPHTNRPPANYQYPAQYPYSYPYQQQQQQQQQIPASAYYPYAYQNNPSGGYQPYAAYYQQPAQPYQSRYTYPYQPTATPEGYSYSATYAPAGQAVEEPQNKRARVTGPTTTPVASVTSVKPWRNCSHPGCKYVGSGEDVEVHEGDRHLIFPNGRKVERSEEEEKWASHKGPPPPIEGTGIVLSTDEDIAKWIAERKAKWPSAKRLAEREEERQAAIARGENPDGGRGRGRGGGRGGIKRSNPAAMAEDWGRPAREEAPIRGGARGKGDRGRGRGRGRGRDQGYGSRAHPSTESTTDTPIVKAEPTLDASTDSKSAGLPLGEYQSEDDSVSDSDPSSDSSSSEEDVSVAPASVVQATKSSRQVCRTFAKTGRCKFGQKCRFDHNIDGKTQEDVKPARVPPGPKQPQPKRTNPFERPSMLGALLAQPIQNTLSQLTQTIRFLVANNMLEGVELNPGDAEEQAREAGKVAILEGEVATDMPSVVVAEVTTVVDDPVLDSQ